MGSPARHLHVSNLLTYVAVLAALGAIVAAKETASAAAAGALIASSVLADTLDGRFARLFHRDDEQRRFGTQLDSLADALSFGFAPVACVYLLLSFESTAQRWVWCGAAALYVLSALTRLGFYTVHAGRSSDFIGVPAPVVGLVWSSYLLARPSIGTSVLLLVVSSVAMVFSIRIPRPRRAGLLAFIGWCVALVIAHGVVLLNAEGLS